MDGCLGQVGLPMKVSTSMVRNMAQASTHGQMVVSMKANGRMDRCMARAYFMLQMVQQPVELGVVAKDLSRSFPQVSLLGDCTLAMHALLWHK